MRGAVAAGHPLSAEAGARVLAEGGNAVDACIGAAFAAFVAEGPLTGPAGGGFLLVHEAGQTSVLDGFFAVPERRLAPDMDEVLIDFEDAGTQAFHVGEGSVAVPGLVAVLEAAHGRFGSLPWPELLEPAIELARAGFQPSDQQAFLYRVLATILLRQEGGRRVYGDRAFVVTRDLAPTLERIRDEGAAAVASLLPELAPDLAAYRVEEREPLHVSCRGYEIAATPDPSRGGAIVTEALALLGKTEGWGAAADLVRALAVAYGVVAAPGRATGTTHVSALDAAGNAAGLSSTLGSGSGVFRGGCQLNNMLGELDVIGVQPREAGTRLPSMMTPTLVLEHGKPRVLAGSAGSVRLAAAIVQVVRHVLGGVPVPEAVARPRVYVNGGTVHLEGGWPDAVSDELRDGGWDVVRWGALNLFFGGVSAVERRTDGGLAAAGDPRRGGAGVVVP